jgi:hypothetical protein
LLTVGRHATSGSDGIDWSDAPVAAGRRRTDGPDALWSGAPSPGRLSDQQTDIGRMRNDGRRDNLLDAALESARRVGARPAAGPPLGGTRAPDGARQLSRSRLPLPPVPPGPRRPATPRVPVAPQTTAAPFQAVPTPEIPAPAVALEALLPEPAPTVAPRERRRSRATAAPAVARPDVARFADPVDPLPAQPARAPRASVPAPRVPRPATPSGAPSPAYGDWAEPSSAELAELAAAEQAGFVSGPLTDGARLRPAPSTTAIPERSVAARRERSDDEADADAPVAAFPSTDEGSRTHATGAVAGGRAARRAELQAADQARREAAKRNGAPIVSPLDEDGPPRRSRVLLGLVAMVVVALGVLGVYQVTSPESDEAGSQAVAATTAPADEPDVAALPTLPPAPTVAEPAVVADVKAPVTVLNATRTNGLAAKIAAAVAAQGWETPAVGTYTAPDVTASTVFFTEGDETQRQAAVHLVNQFPQLKGPLPRSFEVPADIAAPGLIIVTTGDWQP